MFVTEHIVKVQSNEQDIKGGSMSVTRTLAKHYKLEYLLDKGPKESAELNRLLEMEHRGITNRMKPISKESPVAVPESVISTELAHIFEEKETNE